MKLLCCYCDELAVYIEAEAFGWQTALYCHYHKPLIERTHRLKSKKGQKLLAKAIALKLKKPDLNPFWDGVPF